MHERDLHQVPSTRSGTKESLSIKGVGLLTLPLPAPPPFWTTMCCSGGTKSHTNKLTLPLPAPPPFWTPKCCSAGTKSTQTSTDDQLCRVTAPASGSNTGGRTTTTTTSSRTEAGKTAGDKAVDVKEDTKSFFSKVGDDAKVNTTHGRFGAPPGGGGGGGKKKK